MEIDTLVLVIVQRDDADAAIGALTRAGFEVTVIASVGGFLGTRNVTLLIGLAASEIERARAVLLETCHPRAIHAPVKTSIGSATLFVLPIARYFHLNADGVVVDKVRASSKPGALQLILAIVAREQANGLIEMLTAWSYHVTVLGTTGGYSQRANTTLLIAVRAERVDSIIAHVRDICATTANPLATILVLNLAQLQHI